MLFDSHAHLDDRQFAGEVDQVVRRAQLAGVKYILNAGYDVASSRRAVELAEKFDCIYAAVGIHPHVAKEATEEDFEALYQLAQNPKVVAVGEMGLDYYRNLSPRDVQQEVFREQIRLAHRLKLPIIVHDRDAHDDTVTILEEERAGEVGGVLHCFSGSWKMARRCLNLGFYISLAGPVTFKNARLHQEIAKLLPVNHLLVETDSPYLTPEPYRGKRNEPSFVKYVVEQIARLKNMSFEELSCITTENTKRCFNL
ncbi:TatD family hydrolase [Calderihabitans maritimus]|uniref:Mg-dependent DNase n=1 Tax=Calderihabitans maritimus TaxID=1246530 RepID=A0A1Z5HQ17_9FIRM|nr:TatD family hydrolase [Calderihabitans maritimus]GAW91623.1 Mg-dependent DNase [Calderihabitans maritimus]